MRSIPATRFEDMYRDPLQDFIKFCNERLAAVESRLGELERRNAERDEYDREQLERIL